MTDDPLPPTAEGSYEWYRREVDRLRAVLATESAKQASEIGDLTRALAEAEAERDTLKATIERYAELTAEIKAVLDHTWRTRDRRRYGTALTSIDGLVADMLALDTPSTHHVPYAEHVGHRVDVITTDGDRVRGWVVRVDHDIHLDVREGRQRIPLAQVRHVARAEGSLHTTSAPDRRALLRELTQEAIEAGSYGELAPQMRPNAPESEETTDAR